jgi:putative aldouronate transport system permease protein
MSVTYKKKSSIKVSTGRKVFLFCNNTFLILFALICLVPFINLLAVSLSSASANDAGSVGLIPVGFNITSYEILINKKEFWRAFGVSIERVILGTSISLVVNILAAYPLSRPKKQFKYRIFYVCIFVVSMFFYGGVVPNVLLLDSLGLLDKIWALVLPTAFNAWNVVLLISFFREVPTELIEAAEMDGASQWQILFKVVLPVSLPALATVTLFTVVAHWNNWFDAIVYINDESGYPLQTYIYMLLQNLEFMLANPEKFSAVEQAHLSNKALRSAQIFIAMLPIMMVYPFVQKYFIKGLTQGGVKE